MGRSEQRKGKEFEQELVRDARECDLDAKRAWGSNGRSLGVAESVDVMVAGERIQAKRRKSLASYLQVPPECDATVVREDRGESFAILRWRDYLELLARIERLEFAAGEDI